ncbi:MAG: sigma-70 family RNA polymerase sigma factor [Myxococcales bacterium]|nr:sigma-70 family RNA polymerase sigma factor [Myxococcales bacterium]
MNDVAAEPVEPEQLIERAGRGDHDALIALYDRYGATLFSLALRVVRSRSDAEDIVQDAFVRAWREAPSFDRTRGSAATWLATLTRNRAIDHLRAKGRKARREDAHEIESAIDDERRSQTPEGDAARAERAEAVHKAIEALSPEQREALELAYFGGLSHSEIAEELGLPLGTVKTRLLTAAKRLRAALAEHGEHEAKAQPASKATAGRED